MRSVRSLSQSTQIPGGVPVQIWEVWEVREPQLREASFLQLLFLAPLLRHYFLSPSCKGVVIESNQ
jgi:hypothetical protein